MSRRYYLMGVVGVGKSTLREQLGAALPDASIYAEWPEGMAAEVGHAIASMTAENAEEIQQWIFGQLAEKNALIQADSSSQLIIDRSPLDTFAFYPPQQWQQRAQQMLAALASTQLAAGQLLLLTGSPRQMHARMDSSRGYDCNGLAQQQSAFEILADWLAEFHGYHVSRIDARDASPRQVLKQAQAIISSDYRPLDLQAIVEDLARG
ncbi:MAG: AAA family ATPase [Coriobacteriia bacterium]|nr:AAA family ATPase [Coriobacteriia bacterium]MCL2537118.1 AAA family ATPase [Coriobacteriia bacterium]